MPVKKKKTAGKPPFECIALLLQGGGALGAYQAGVYEALHNEGIEPNWVAGISIGAINSAIIAGNKPENRVKKLRQFWENITIAAPLNLAPYMQTDFVHTAFNQFYAGYNLLQGAPGFFEPRLISPWLQPKGAIGATSFYDNSHLAETLNELIDFELLNNNGIRFSVSAVNIRSGNFVYFDNAETKIKIEHILASCALPPGFPPVEVEGEFYWDGGLVSNTPLDWVLNSSPQLDTLAFQVDLWSSRGALPHSMPEVLTRQKEIQFSSRTRSSTDRFTHAQELRYALANLLDKAPAEMKKSADFKMLRPEAQRKVYNIVELIYRTKQYEDSSKDYEFSRQSMEEHWKAGHFDIIRSLRHGAILKRPPEGSVQTFDFCLG